MALAQRSENTCVFFLEAVQEKHCVSRKHRVGNSEGWKALEHQSQEDKLPALAPQQGGLVRLG